MFCWSDWGVRWRQASHSSLFNVRLKPSKRVDSRSFKSTECSYFAGPLGHITHFDFCPPANKYGNKKRDNCVSLTVTAEYNSSNSQCQKEDYWEALIRGHHGNSEHVRYGTTTRSFQFNDSSHISQAAQASFLKVLRCFVFLIDNAVKQLWLMGVNPPSCRIRGIWAESKVDPGTTGKTQLHSGRPR